MPDPAALTSVASSESAAATVIASILREALAHERAAAARMQERNERELERLRTELRMLRESSGRCNVQ